MSDPSYVSQQPARVCLFRARFLRRLLNSSCASHKPNLTKSLPVNSYWKNKGSKPLGILISHILILKIQDAVGACLINHAYITARTMDSNNNGRALRRRPKAERIQWRTFRSSLPRLLKVGVVTHRSFFIPRLAQLIISTRSRQENLFFSLLKGQSKDARV